MPEVKRTPKEDPKPEKGLYDDPQPGTVKDEKTGKYKYPSK